MRIRRNPGILGHDRALKNAGRRHQQLIGGISVEGLRQLGGLHQQEMMLTPKTRSAPSSRTSRCFG